MAESVGWREDGQQSPEIGTQWNLNSCGGMDQRYGWIRRCPFCETRRSPTQLMGVLRNITRRREAEEQLQQSLQKLGKTLEGTIQAIRVMVDSRDRYTAGHQQRVTELACAIAEALGLPPERIQALHVAGLLHDVGKILLPTEILDQARTAERD